MKKKRNSKEAAVSASATDGNLVPTVFDQLVVINAELCSELEIVPNAALPRPRIAMPGWCGNIVKQFGKTIFKPIRKLAPQGKVDWRNYGKLVGMIERYKTFLIHDVPRIAEEELGDITDEQWKRIEPQLGLDQTRACLIKALDRPVADDESLENLGVEAVERQFEALETHRQVALAHVASQDSKATALFYKGMGEGYESFLDERGKFCGDRGRTDIHLTLISCMMEVEKFRQKLPPTSRPRYYDSLTKVFRLTPKAYDWFNDVCDDIKFPLNNLGRKRRDPALIL